MRDQKRAQRVGPCSQQNSREVHVFREYNNRAEFFFRLLRTLRHFTSTFVCPSVALFDCHLTNRITRNLLFLFLCGFGWLFCYLWVIVNGERQRESESVILQNTIITCFTRCSLTGFLITHEFSADREKKYNLRNFENLRISKKIGEVAWSIQNVSSFL